MTIEVAAAFNVQGYPLFWSVPEGCSGGAVADSSDFWSLIWDNRFSLCGIAHTHPWDGHTAPSGTDVTTWSAIERALGKELIWPIVTLTQVFYFEFSRNPNMGYQGFVESSGLSIIPFRYETPWLETILKMRHMSLNNGG